MAGKGSKKYLVVTFAIIAIGAFITYMVLNKPSRNIASEESIKISSAQLVKEYQEDETAANLKYLDKAIQVTGAVAEVSVNQEGKSTIMLASDDAMTGVFCTLKDNTQSVKNGSVITVKGFCSGMLSDVRLREAIVVN